MIRFVLDPDRKLVPDLAERLPGRGMWLSAKADVLEHALRRGAFAKAARGEVHAHPDLRAFVEDGLRGRVRDLVGFARRAGQAVMGWGAAREWLLTGRAGLMVHAADGSPAEKARLIGHRQVPVVDPLSAADLGSLFGRDRAVHVAIASGRLAESIAAEAARLAGMIPKAGTEGATPPGGNSQRGGRKPGENPARPDANPTPQGAEHGGRDLATNGKGRIRGTE
jgi:ribosomal protein L7Ae-like RNA K-turn-binding protein